MTVEIRALRPDDDRALFRSGDEALDLYFHRYAGQNQFRHHLGVTYVAVEDDPSGQILGFATVASGQLDADALPGAARRAPYPVPVLRLARLATSEGARGRGLGAALLRFVVELAERVRDEVGCVGIVVDAKAGAAGFYKRYGFVPVTFVEGAAATVPAPQPMFLALASVPRRR